MSDVYGKFKLNKGEFKPCPFCGGEPYEQVNYNEDIDASFTFVKCSLCGGQAKVIFTRGYHCELDKEMEEADDLAFAAWEQREKET